MTITEWKRMRSQHQPVGRWIRVDKRLAIYLRDGFRCQVCTANLHGTDPFNITLDHYVPTSQGGSNESDNLYTCCRSCNSSRQTKPLSKAKTRRVLAAMAGDLAPYRKLAKSILGDRDAWTWRNIRKAA